MSAVADEWLTTALASITGSTGTYEGRGPTTQPYPFVVYQDQSSQDVNGVGADVRIMADDMYIVRVISRVTSYGSIKSIADDVDEALHGQINVATASGLVLACQRQSEYRLLEELEGRQIRHLGGVYRILTQTT